MDEWTKDKTRPDRCSDRLQALLEIFVGSVCAHVCVSVMCCYLWGCALFAGAFTLVLSHITHTHTHMHSQTHTPLAYINVNTTFFFLECQGGSIALKVRCKVAYIRHQRGVTWTTVLHLALESVSACMDTQRSRSVREGEMDGESGERVTPLKWTLQGQRGQSWTTPGHLWTTANGIYTHNTHRWRGGKNERSTFVCTNTILLLFVSFLFHNPAFSVLLFPLFLSKFLPNKQRI